MKRRDFVLIGTAAIAAVAIPAAYYYLGDVEYDRELAQPQSLSLILDNQTINTIGNQYRLQTAGEKSERSLVNLLRMEDPIIKDSLLSDLENKVRNDFKSGNTVIVDGWILSVTEARQCALASTIELK